MIFVSSKSYKTLSTIITRHSLVRAKGEVFVLLLLFCSFFLSTISRQPVGQFTPNFACRRTLVPNVFSPLLGVGGPRRAEKWGNFCYYGSQWGILAFWRFLSDISATLARIHTKYYLCRDNVCRRAPSPCGAHRPLGGGGEGVKNSKNGGGLIRAQDSYHFYFSQRCQMWSSM